MWRWIRWRLVDGPGDYARFLLLALILAGVTRAQDLTVVAQPSIELVAQTGPVLDAGVEMQGPFGVSVAASGDLYVADDLGHRVHVLDADMRFERSFGRHGTEAGEFAYLDAVVEGPDGLLYVADTGNNRLQQLQPDGQVTRVFDRWRWLAGRFSNPRSIVFENSSGNFFVADWGNHTVHLFDAAHRHLRRIGNRGDGAGELQHPIDVAVAADGRVFVSDHGNNRIQVFSLDGSFIGSIGGGVGALVLDRPSGIALGPDGLLFIVDSGNHRVVIVTAAGELVTSFGERGTGPGQFQQPSDIALGQAGNVYVVDKGNHRIQRFKLSHARE